MLGKLFKYEVKATSRVILPLYVGLLGLTLLFRLFSVFRPDHRFALLQETMSAIAVTVFIILIIATFVVTFVVMLSRFSKNLFGDEGYLMHTLPVSAAQNIWAKALCSAMWSVISTVVAALTGFIFFFGDMLPDVGNVLSQLWAELRLEILPYLSMTDSVFIGVVLAEIVLCMLLSLIAGPLFFYVCISLGQHLSRHKLLGSFCVYLLATFLIQCLSAGVTLIASYSPIARWFYRLFVSNGGAAISLVLGASLLLTVIGAVVCFCITNNQLSRHLNLE